MRSLRRAAPLSALLAAVFLASSCGSPPPKDPYCSYSPLPEAKAGKGAIQVEGGTGAYVYVSDSSGKSLGNPRLGGMLALDPGKYQLKLNGSLHTVTVQKGSLTKCASGTLVVKGETKAYYYVRDAAGKSLSESDLNKQTALFPGTYRILVNGSSTAVELAAAQNAEVQTGTMVVEASGRDYYYVRDPAGKSLSERHANTPLSVFPGEYAVKFKDDTRPVAVQAGQTTRVKF